MYIIYNEMVSTDGIKRWYYGQYADPDKANDLAERLSPKGEDGVWTCVCKAEDAEALHILNLPDKLTARI